MIWVKGILFWNAGYVLAREVVSNKAESLPLTLRIMLSLNWKA